MPAGPTARREGASSASSHPASHRGPVSSTSVPSISTLSWHFLAFGGLNGRAGRLVAQHLREDRLDEVGRILERAGGADDRAEGPADIDVELERDLGELVQR